MVEDGCRPVKGIAASVCTRTHINLSGSYQCTVWITITSGARYTSREVISCDWLHTRLLPKRRGPALHLLVCLPRYLLGRAALVATRLSLEARVLLATSGTNLSFNSCARSLRSQQPGSLFKVGTRCVALLAAGSNWLKLSRRGGKKGNRERDKEGERGLLGSGIRS